jgi:hypothetical protein
MIMQAVVSLEVGIRHQSDRSAWPDCRLRFSFVSPMCFLAAASEDALPLQ